MAKTMSPQPFQSAPVRELPREPCVEPAETAAAAQPELPSVERGAARLHPRPAGKRSAIRERERLLARRRYGGQSVRRFGDNLPVLNPVGFSRLNYDPDHELSYMDSSEHIWSSSDKENVNPVRKRFMDDALFQFFRKESVKSLKRDVSQICNDSNAVAKNKRRNAHLIGRDDFSSYSIKYFWDVLKSLSPHRKEVIRKFGFSCLLLFEKSEVPSAFVRWLASCVDPVSSQIIVDDFKIISISKESVYHVTGLPNSGSVPLPNSDRGSKFILNLFGLTELPHITFFGNKLKSKEVLNDKEIFVCFVTVAFKCFLFPSPGDLPNTDLLHILEDPESVKCVDICLLVYEHIISGASKYISFCKKNGRKPDQFEFCYYILAVYYLDSLDFGARMVDQCAPRFSVWKGNMIKFFFDLDHRKKKQFGKRQLKKSLSYCYREGGLAGYHNSGNDGSFGASESFCFSKIFMDNLHNRFGNILEAKIINGILDSVQAAAVSQGDNSSKCELCVNNVLQFLMVSKSSENKSTDIRNSELDKPRVAANDSFCINTKSEGNETDIARNLEVLNPNAFPHTLESPECIISKPAQSCTINTAPAMPPMKKVKSRLDQGFTQPKTFPAGVKDDG